MARRGGVYRVHKHARHGGVSWRGRARQTIRQATTNTAISASVFQPERAKPTSTTVRRRHRHHGLVSGPFFAIGIKCVIRPGKWLATRMKPFFRGRLVTNPQAPPAARNHPSRGCTAALTADEFIAHRPCSRLRRAHVRLRLTSKETERLEQRFPGRCQCTVKAGHSARRGC